MIRFGFAQTRAGWRRLLAAAVAVMLGAAFIAVTIAGANVMHRAALRDAAATMGGADFTVYVGEETMPPEEIEALPGVEDYYYVQDMNLAFGAGDSIVTVIVSTWPPSAAFTAPELVDGAVPVTAEEISVSEALASRLGLEVGDTVEVYALPWDSALDPVTPLGETLRVSGITASVDRGYYGAFEAHAPVDGITRLAEAAGLNAELSSAIRISSSDPEALGAALQESPAMPLIESREEIAQLRFTEYTGLANPISVFSVIFILIALVVATLVVGNTFQVLVSQRTNLIGILRSVGATKRQIRILVTQEAVITGLAGGILGMAAGNVVAWVLFVVIDSVLPNSPVSGTFSISWQGVVMPILGAVLVTLVAALTPAGAAARTAPLAAVRRVTSPRPQTATPARFVGATLVAVGILTSVVALVMRTWIDAQGVVDSSPLLVLAVFGLLVFGAGFLLVSPLFFPGIAGAIGAVIARVSPRWARSPVHLARTNLKANPRRTTATSNALLVGVTLVSMLTTGAATAHASLSAVASSMLPTDISVSLAAPGAATLTPEIIEKVRRVDGVVAVAPLTMAWVSVGSPAYLNVYEVWAGDAGLIAEASYSETLGRPIDDDTLLIGPDAGLANGADVAASIMPDDSSDWDLLAEDPSRPTITMRVEHAGIPALQAFVSPSTAEALGMDTSSPTTLWVRAESGRMHDVATTIANLLPSNMKVGVGRFIVDVPGEARARMVAAIDNVVLAAAALLAISIVIALVGVANTLSLSVFERRREIALLRCVGLTRAQLRASLAIEGLIITAAATVIGITLGAAIGALGGSFLFTGTAGTQIRLPWLAYGIVFVVALLAGPLASVLPARQAMQESPVDNLDSV